MTSVPDQILQLGLPHRPWPYPKHSWAIRQDWVQLSFLHWNLEPKSLQSLLPAGLELDTFDGKAYLGLVPFVMSNVRPSYLPCVPGISRFPELNLRTYVQYEGIPGVLFFSLDAASRLAVWLGRKQFHVPYFFSKMRIETRDNSTRYSSYRHQCPNGENAFVGSVTGVGDSYYAEPGSLEHWLTERYCFYAEQPNGQIARCDVAHAPWLLRKGIAEIEINSLVQPFGIDNCHEPDLVHVSPGVRVLGWKAG